MKINDKVKLNKIPFTGRVAGFITMNGATRVIVKFMVPCDKPHLTPFIGTYDKARLTTI